MAPPRKQSASQWGQPCGGGVDEITAGNSHVITACRVLASLQPYIPCPAFQQHIHPHRPRQRSESKEATFEVACLGGF